MSYQLKCAQTGTVFTTSEEPTYVHGVWECGDQRFTDQDGTLYVTVPQENNLPLLTPMTFYLAFTPAERMAIKASKDEHIVEFWATYQLAVQLDKPVDPNLVSVSQAISYLAMPAPGPGIIDPERITQILSGVAQ